MHVRGALVTIQKEAPVLPGAYKEGHTPQAPACPSAPLLGPGQAPLGPCVCHLAHPTFQTTPEPSASHFASGS